MYRTILTVTLTLLLAGASHACGVKKTGAIVAMLVNGWDKGDTCKVSEFPAPFNTLAPIKQGPNISAFGWTYVNQQYGYAYFVIDQNGTGNIFIKMTNHKRFDGDTFTAAIVFKDADQKPMHVVETRLGVNGPPFRPNENTTAIPISKPPEWWKRVQYLTFYHGRFNRVDDQKNWNAVYEILKKAWEIINSSEGSEKKPS